MTTNPTLRRCTAAFLATIACLLANARALAQDVLVSEVRADGERWVEVHNRSANTVDLSAWSLHYATRTPGTGQSYWWPFPPGTTLAADRFLRVHWFQAAPAGGGAPGDLWTGTSPYGFLFGLGGEALHADRGAFALFRSQQNELMNTAAVIEDWVSWGDNGFARETLAVAAGRWSAGRHLGAVPPGSSHARDTALLGAVAFHDLAWFVDATPTPLLANTTGALVQSHGTACTLPGNHLLGLPALSAPELPLVGSAQFRVVVANTTGIWCEFVLLAFSAAAAPGGVPSILPPFAGVACHEALDLQQLVTTWLVPTQLLATTLPLPLAGLSSSAVGAELHAQALVFDLMPYASPPFQGVTNALRIVVGQ